MHTAIGPSLAQLYGQAGSMQKCDGCMDQLGIHGRGQGRQAWLRNDIRVAVERAYQKAHVTAKRQPDVVLHLLVFFSP
jgi:hypothetical protein